MFIDEYLNKTVEIDWVTKSNNAAQQLVERATYEFKFTVSNAEAMTLITVLEQMGGVQ